MTAPTQPVPVRFDLTFRSAPNVPPMRTIPISTLVSVVLADLVYDNAAAPPMSVTAKARLVLQRPLSRDSGIHDWYTLANQIDIHARRDCSLVGYAADGRPAVTFYLAGARPVRIELSSAPGGAPVETIVLECDDFGRGMEALPTN